MNQVDHRPVPRDGHNPVTVLYRDDERCGRRGDPVPGLPAPSTDLLGSGRARQWAVIVAGGIIFGLGHLVQGPLGVFNAGVIGVIFGWAWLRSGRNLWATILAHALVDTYGIGMLYIGRYA